MAEGPARIVEVGGKEVTERVAVAECVVSMTPDALGRLVAGTRKGNPLEAARIAGVMGVKRTPDLLPFCHPVAVTGAEVELEPDGAAGTVRVRTTVRATDRTGVEMEALTAAAVAALSLYDTAKEFDRSARIDELRLLEKQGGKSGRYVAS
jgi:cyclic pyranopterin phosphate synthase